MEHKETNFVRDESSGSVREESTVVNDTGPARHGGHLPRIWNHRWPSADPVGAQAAGSESARGVRKLYLWPDRLLPRSVPRPAADRRQRAIGARAISDIRDPDLLADRPCPRAIGGDHDVSQRDGVSAEPLGRVQASHRLTT